MYCEQDITQHPVLRGPGWQIVSCCVVGNHTQQDNYRKKKKKNVTGTSVNIKYCSSSAQYILNSLVVTIKEGNFALKQYVFVLKSNRKPQNSRDQCWRLKAKANTFIHPERLDVSFLTFPYHSHRPTRKGHAGTFLCLQLALVMNLPCGSLQPLNELTELKQHLTQTELSACTNTLWKVAVEGMRCLAVPGQITGGHENGLTLVWWNLNSLKKNTEPEQNKYQCSI